MQEILDRWKIKIDYKTILTMWNESHRHYHSQGHLITLIDRINESKSTLNSEKEYDKLILTALFHDIIYNPKNENNEEKSAEFFLNLCEEKTKDHLEIYQSIIDTKNHKSSNSLSERFNKLDMEVVEGSIDTLLEWERGIWEEYKIFGSTMYKAGRIKFLNSLLDKYNHNAGNLLKLIDYVKKSY